MLIIVGWGKFTGWKYVGRNDRTVWRNGIRTRPPVGQLSVQRKFRFSVSNSLSQIFCCWGFISYSLWCIRLVPNIYRVPKLATPLASNTLILIQFEVHGFQWNIVHCTILTLLSLLSYLLWHTHLTVCVQCDIIMTSEFADYGMNLTSVLLTRRSSSGAPA